MNTQRIQNEYDQTLRKAKLAYLKIADIAGVVKEPPGLKCITDSLFEDGLIDLIVETDPSDERIYCINQRGIDFMNANTAC